MPWNTPLGSAIIWLLWSFLHKKATLINMWMPKIHCIHHDLQWPKPRKILEQSLRKWYELVIIQWAVSEEIARDNQKMCWPQRNWMHTWSNVVLRNLHMIHRWEPVEQFFWYSCYLILFQPPANIGASRYADSAAWSKHQPYLISKAPVSLHTWMHSNTHIEKYAVHYVSVGCCLAYSQLPNWREVLKNILRQCIYLVLM